MLARHIARELTLLLFSQLETYSSNISKKDFENIIVKSVRILSNNANEELQMTLRYLFETKEYIQNYENESSINMARPLEAKNLPVEIPKTDEMIKKIDTLIEVSEKAIAAMEIAEMATIEEKKDVRDFTIDIANLYIKNRKDVDEIIDRFADGWNIDRLIKIDKDILRIAVCELVYMQNMPSKVVLNEAVELAKKYSTEDSSSFINGVLAKVVEEYGIKK